MAIPATTAAPPVTAVPAAPPAPSCASEAVLGLYNIALSGGAGALAAWAFTIIDPIGGAIFGVASALTNSLGRVMANVPGTEAAVKTAVHFLTFIASLAVGAAAVTLAGFQITLMSAVGLSLAMIPAWIAVSCSANCIGCCAP
jgi:hypothetical protein